MSAGRLEGKTAVITGATGGMGRVACRMFCAEGAVVLGSDIDEQAGRHLESDLRKAGHEFDFIRCDVSSPADVAALAKRARECFHRLDVLYNNAGTLVAKSLVETTDAEWDRILDVNLKGAFLTMRELVPLMGPGSSIVNVASGLGLIGAPQLGAYCASKGGLVLLTKAAALELGPDIRVNALCPGIIDTPMPHRIVDGLPADVARALFQSFEQQHLVGRLGRPEEVVAMGIFLASDESTFMTGAAIPVDSGVTAR